MKCAVLGNGPSLNLYYSSEVKYDKIIGCNIPWTVVDFTVIMDEEIVDLWAKNYNLILVPAYFSIKAWGRTDRSNLRQFLLDNNLFLGLIKDRDLISTGHMAAKKVIELGANELDLYGFDSYHNETIDSITWDYIKNNPTNNSKYWIKAWNNIMKNNPNIVFNFI